ncbi:MAG: excinuclease ABC subunit UvrC [Clostridia bacterium]|nr:excinuclease ABC subunit UvrC [Clostridia bacterium]
MNDVISEKLKLLPDSPGVYVMLNADGHVIYVGKAKVLKNRVRQYFHAGVKTDKVMAMVNNIVDFYYIITNSEIDALSLENNLIKKYKPRYNILLKDDKTYPYVRINLKEPYPRFEITRRVRFDGAKYFGPFMGGVSVKEVLEIVNRCFELRTCKQTLPNKSVKRECINYHIGRCHAPCTAQISPADYRARVDGAIDFLSGNDDAAETLLKEKMLAFADEGQFEAAIDCRNKLAEIAKIKEHKITDLNRFINADIIALMTDGVYGAVNVLITRSGRMQGGKNFSVSTAVGDEKSMLSEFILRYYRDGRELPDEIVLYSECEDGDVLEKYFKETFRKSVSIIVPKQGVRRQLADMAGNNAKDHLEKSVGAIQHKDDKTVTACARLKDILSLSRYPKRMECYDISNVSGVDKVASMVVFTDGEKDAKEYRRFTIKTVEGANDFASLKETLTRRLNKLGTEEEARFPKPDLIVIDGGKGQLSSVKEVFDELNITDIDLISLAKREEEIFTVRSNVPVVLPHSDYCLRMLQAIRDEAHRFAITYFRNKHNKRNLSLRLDGIKGVGKVRKEKLFERFGTAENIARAELEDIAGIEGFGEKYAKLVYEWFKKEEER